MGGRSSRLAGIMAVIRGILPELGRTLLVLAAVLSPRAARALGRRQLRALCGRPIPDHVYDVVFVYPEDGFKTTIFRFKPPLVRDGWPRGYEERWLTDGGNGWFDHAICSGARPPLQVTRRYYRGELDKALVSWIYVDETSNRAVLWRLG